MEVRKMYRVEFVDLPLGWYWRVYRDDALLCQGVREYTTKSSAKRGFDRLFNVRTIQELEESHGGKKDETTLEKES